MEGNTSKENLKSCRVQGKYAGTVEDIHKGTVFVVVTHIDEERNVAVGIITRIIKQSI
ncbi:hypothetical protein [Mediterraneibacter gnavus]|uniref:hypothetical protein n=1 Tax=Mediterraneibacter gnavus TaxID=33038 RepID=UPI0022E8D447